jgi:hypothetical protein
VAIAEASFLSPWDGIDSGIGSDRSLAMPLYGGCCGGSILLKGKVKQM